MLELIPLYEAEYTLAPPRVVEGTPFGTQVLFEVTDGRVDGERISGRVSELCGDWVTVSPDGRVGSLDVRLTVETDDGASVLVSYRGRTALEEGAPSRPLYVAPLFVTGDERYEFLNTIQAVGKGELSADMSSLKYEVFELR